MTVIAYRKGILAGDSCWSEASGLLVNIQNKLVRLSAGAIYGGAGAPDDRALLKLLQNVRSPEQLPQLRDLQEPYLGDLECLLILPDRTVWTIESGPDGYGVCPVKTPFAAIGAGREIAMGALAANKTAEEAVRIACDWHRTCCRPVHTLHLKEDTTVRTKATGRGSSDQQERRSADAGLPGENREAAAASAGAEGA